MTSERAGSWCERHQQLAQRPGFDNHFGHAGTLTGNSEELDVHRLVYCPSFGFSRKPRDSIAKN